MEARKLKWLARILRASPNDPMREVHFEQGTDRSEQSIPGGLDKQKETRKPRADCNSHAMTHILFLSSDSRFEAHKKG